MKIKTNIKNKRIKVSMNRSAHWLTLQNVFKMNKILEWIKY